MKFSVYQVSRRGGRPKNEDRMGYCYTRSSGLFALADGMGGLPEGEVASQLALQTALAGRTSVVIAHRLSTVRNADLILTIVGGRIVERGTHTDLLAAGGAYAELYRTQFARQGAA